MAKGQKRSNREVRKPKAKKSVTAPAPSALERGSLTPVSATNKKR